MLRNALAVIATAITIFSGNIYAFELNNILPKDLAGIEVPAPLNGDALSATLNTAANRAMHTTLLLAVGGVKPFSDISPDEGTPPQINPVNEIDILIQSHALTNPDLLFFKTLCHPEDPASEMMVIASKKGIARLLKDKTVIGTLDKYKTSIPYDIPQDIEGWVDFYKKAVAADGYSYLGPVWANLVIGISMGYPPLEAEMYANNLQNDHIQRQPIGTHRPGFMLAGYVRFTDRELERDEYYVGSENVLMDNYEHLTTSGRAPLVVMNHPDWLAQGMPSFPMDFLLPKVLAVQPNAYEIPSPISRNNTQYTAIPSYLLTRTSLPRTPLNRF